MRGGWRRSARRHGSREEQSFTAASRRGCRENSSGPVVRLLGMGARFIGCDRDQVFLMPPSLHDWVPEGHLVWTVLDAVGELDLSAIYADYRDDGRGRCRPRSRVKGGRA